VKTAGLIASLIVLLLFACYPKKPEIAMTAVPASPLLEALDRQRQTFTSLKAVASATFAKSGRKRTYDSVGVVIDDQRRFRLEAYGPLGQSIMAIVWDGQEILLRLPDENRVDHKGPAGLEQLLGQGLEPSELCAILSGNVPEEVKTATSVLLCGTNNDCILKLSSGDLLRTFRVSYPVDQPGWQPRIRSYELSRSGSILFRAQFDRVEEISHYPLPMQIDIENPEKNLKLTIVYHEANVNTAIDNEAFSLTDESGAENRK
jgi:outer membrane lipoprotein-sorting protein